MKIQVHFALVIVGMLALAAGLVSVKAQESPKLGNAKADQQELAKLEGDWVYAAQESKATPAPPAGRKVTIKGDQFTMVTPRPGGGEPFVGVLKIKIDASQEPKHIDQTAPTGSTRLGIYKLEGETLTLAFDRDVKARPKEIKATAGGTSLTVLQRTGPASPTPPPSTTPLAAQPRAMPADVKAYMDARAIQDPAKKIEALEKFRTEFPTSAYAATINRELVLALIKAHSNQKEKLLEQFDKLIASVPETESSEMLNTVAWELMGAGVLIDEAERYSVKSIALLDEQKFIDAQKRAAAARKQPVPADEVLKKRFRTVRGNTQDTLGQIYRKQGKSGEAEKLLKEALAGDPTMAGAAAGLAELAQAKGDDATALDYLASAVVGSRPPAGTKDKLEALYAKLHKDASEGSLDKLLDTHYRKLYPTLSVAHYKPTPERSDRAVLAEVFTGAACPPCVAADLAFDAMLERYSRKDLIVMMYHLHIPAPDPLTNPSTQARSRFYGVRGVPSYVLDGEMKSGGGSRDMTQGFYDRVNPTIEQRLEAAAEAQLSLSASLDGTKAKVKADVSQIKGDAKDTKLQVALVEEMLSYNGENGIRLHPVVVRSLAGPDAGGFTVDPGKPASIEHTFDIAGITDEIKKHLDDFEKTAPGGRKFSQKKHAIDASNLSVVAFVQDQTSKKILQAAYVRLKPEGVAAK